MPKKDWEPKWTEQGWAVSFSIEGRRIRRRLGIRDKSLKGVARAKAQQLYKEKWAAQLAIPTNKEVPFWEATKGYVDDGGEARFLPKLIGYFGKYTTIDQIGELEIVNCAMELYPNAVPETRRRQVRVPITAVVRWARGERKRPSTDNKRVRWLHPEEAEALLKAAAQLTLPRHDKPEPYTLKKIAFLLGSGCRTGECFAADINDWNPATSQQFIPAEEDGAGKTVSSERLVRLPSRAVCLMGELPESGRMFRTPYGKPIKLRKNGGGQMQASFNKARDAAGLGKDVTPHVLRHTWATWYYAQTRDFGGLMDLGGWAKSEMANRYRKIAPDDLADRLLEHGWDFRQKSGNIELDSRLRIVK